MTMITRQIKQGLVSGIGALAALLAASGCAPPDTCGQAQLGLIESAAAELNSQYAEAIASGIPTHVECTTFDVDDSAYLHYSLHIGDYVSGHSYVAEVAYCQEQTDCDYFTHWDPQNETGYVTHYVFNYDTGNYDVDQTSPLLMNLSKLQVQSCMSELQSRIDYCVPSE